MGTFKPYFTDDVFGITILQNQEHCDLSMAGHILPQQLSISGHIKYKPAALKELLIYNGASIGGESAFTASLYSESVDITFECYTRVFLPDKPDLWHYIDYKLP